VAVFDRPGGKVAFHHHACQSEDERACTSAIPLQSAIQQLALSLGLPSSAPRKQARVRQRSQS
jgi:hypothetical protein